MRSFPTRLMVYGAWLNMVLVVARSTSAQPVAESWKAFSPPGPYFPVTARQLHAIESFRAGQPIIGTHFFYWYNRKSGAHFINDDDTDALTDHPANSTGYSFESAAWWRRELLDVMAAEIDFILPVYWGYPGDYDAWSFQGLPHLVTAWEALVREGKHPPRVGLFYDTSTLRHNSYHWHVDLSTDAGKRWFYTSIRDYFSCIPPKMWAAIDGRPIVVLYSPNFAARQDPALFPFVRKQFKKDFGTDFYLVKHVGWEGRADKVCQWGGALGLKAHSVAALGPGYDHSAVPKRKPLVVDRQDGKFYEQQWQQFLSYDVGRRAKMVLVETWNELHEGTDICVSKEYGRQYIRLTAKYAKMFHDGLVLPKTGPFSHAKEVQWQADRSTAPGGLHVKNGGDGLVESHMIGGRKCWRTRANPYGNSRYFYFDIDDRFLFDEPGAKLTVTVEYLDQGFATWRLEFDSIDVRASVREGAFKSADRACVCHHSGKWMRAKFVISNGRFANRCNTADFRFAITGGDLAVTRVTARLQ